MHAQDTMQMNCVGRERPEVRAVQMTYDPAAMKNAIRVRIAAQGKSLAGVQYHAAIFATHPEDCRIDPHYQTMKLHSSHFLARSVCEQ